MRPHTGKGYTEVRLVHIMLNVFQPFTDQFSLNLRSPQNDLCPWLQVQDAEVSLQKIQGNA